MRYGDDLCAVCSSVIRDYMAVFKPTCVAPTFGPTTNGFACFLVTLVLALVVFLLSFESWNPQIECTRKRLRFRIQNCSVGNDDPCLDLG
jgi:hypothetical protein